MSEFIDGAVIGCMVSLGLIATIWATYHMGYTDGKEDARMLRTAKKFERDYNE